MGAEDEVGGVGLGIFPSCFDEVDVLDVVVTGFFEEGLGHGGGRLDGGQVTAAEGEGEGQTTGAGADVDEGMVGLDFEGEAVQKGVVGAVGVGTEADGHAVPVVVVGVGLVA